MTETPVPFGARLREALDTRGPLCVGVDPHASLLGAWSLPDSVSGLERFAMTVVEALAERVAVLKPQSSFFERFGSGGVAVLERTIAAARAAAWARIEAPTVSPCSVSARCTEAPSGFEVKASTNTPRPLASARAKNGSSEPKPRYGETVTASADSGEDGSR